MFTDLELVKTKVMHSRGTRSNSHGGKHGALSPPDRGCSHHANAVVKTKVANLPERSHAAEATVKLHINIRILAKAMASILPCQDRLR